MPTYDYKCADCGRLFEKFHGMNEQPQVVCPECQSVNTARQVSLGAGIVFKGSGFYVNDYKKTDSGSTTKTAAKTKDDDDEKTKLAATKAALTIPATKEIRAATFSERVVTSRVYKPKEKRKSRDIRFVGLDVRMGLCLEAKSFPFARNKNHLLSLTIPSPVFLR